MTYFMTSSFVKFLVADSQRSHLLIRVVDYVSAVLTRLLAAFDCKPYEMVLKLMQAALDCNPHLTIRYLSL